MKKLLCNSKTMKFRALSVLLSLIILAMIMPGTPVSAAEGYGGVITDPVGPVFLIPHTDTFPTPEYNEFEYFYYTDNGDYINIIGNQEHYIAFSIPSEINGKPVTHIDPYFHGIDGMTATDVTIPNSVTYIGRGAFIMFPFSVIRFESRIPPTVIADSFNTRNPDIDYDALYCPIVIVPDGASAYGPEGSLWNGMRVVYNRPAQIPVTGIAGVPTTATAKTPLTLTGMVNPSDATNKTITWSVESAGTTGATISGNMLYTTAEGSVIVRATIVNGLTANTDYVQDFKITVIPPRGSFIMGIDNYRFSNTWSSFGYSTDYVIPLERYYEIFTSSRAEYLFNWINKEDQKWGGSCFGLASSAYAFKAEYLTHSDYQAGVSTTYGFNTPETPNSPVTQLIELYQLSQFLPETNSARSDLGPNYNNLTALISAADNNDGLIVIIRGSAGGHAVLAYGVESLGGTRYSLKIYDNNQPANANLRIEIDTSRLGSSAWSFNSADTQSYNSRLGENITFLSGKSVYEEIAKAVIYNTYGVSDMQISAPANAEIANSHGVSVENISEAYMSVPLGVLPLNSDGSDPTPQRTTEMWVVPEDEYKVGIEGTENTSVSVLDDNGAYIFNLIPKDSNVTVKIGHTVEVEGAVHGSVTVFQNDGTQLILPVIAGSPVGLSLGSGMEKYSFNDVWESHWFYEAVTSIASAGIVNGVGENRFDPQGGLTVAHLVTMLMRVQYGLLPVRDTWYSIYIERAEHDGILYSSDNFDPNAEITRAQMALIVTRYIERFNPRWAKDRVTNTPIDVADVPDVYRYAVEKAYAWNIIRGDENNRFNPQNTLTRAEAAQVLFNYFNIVD